MTRILDDVKLDFRDVLFVPQRSDLGSRSEVELTKNYIFKHSKLCWTGVPIISANMDGVGTVEVAKVLMKHGMMTSLVKHYTTTELFNFFNYTQSAPEFCAYSLGISDEDLKKFDKFKESFSPRFVTIDVANGYSQKFVEFVKKFRDSNPTVTLMAGNVATAEMTSELIIAGVDIVKVGIGSGNACSTRVKTGVGYPQLSAILECANAAHGLGGHIISDGGITCPGDIGKAFGAGADFVMIGSFLAGTDEGGGEIQYNEGCPFIQFYGMSSKTAQEKHGNGLAEYRASEGRVIKVPYKGPIEPIVLDILGSLRSTCTYTGSKNLKELPKRTTFCKVNQQISTLYGVGELMK